MNDFSFQPNENQRKAIFWLRDRQGFEAHGRDEILADTGMTNSDFDRLFRFLEAVQAIRIIKIDAIEYAAAFKTAPGLAEVVYQLENQPPPDYWKAVEVWFRSRK